MGSKTGGCAGEHHSKQLLVDPSLTSPRAAPPAARPLPRATARPSARPSASPIVRAPVGRPVRLPPALTTARPPACRPVRPPPPAHPLGAKPFQQHWQGYWLPNFCGWGPLGATKKVSQSKGGWLFIAKLRHGAAVETTIEEKHARTTLARKRHHIGPVRLSLANRLPLLGRWLQKKHVSPEDLLRKFSEARSLKRAATLLGLRDHPDVIRSNTCSSSWRVILGKKYLSGRPSVNVHWRIRGSES